MLCFVFSLFRLYFILFLIIKIVKKKKIGGRRRGEVMDCFYNEVNYIYIDYF